MVQPRHGVARRMDVAHRVAVHFTEHLIGLEVKYLDGATGHPHGPFLGNDVVFEGDGIAGWGLTGTGGFGKDIFLDRKRLPIPADQRA